MFVILDYQFIFWRETKKKKNWELFEYLEGRLSNSGLHCRVFWLGCFITGEIAPFATMCKSFLLVTPLRKLPGFHLWVISLTASFLWLRRVEYWISQCLVGSHSHNLFKTSFDTFLCIWYSWMWFSLSRMY